MRFQKPKGTKDILPAEMAKWHFAEKTVREVMECYNYFEIRTPTFEHTDLFSRGVGSETDIVGKEMYTFLDKGGNSLTLKPEGTAPVVRAYLENGLSSEAPVHKLYYITNMFRYEKPQEGRYREHTQFGAEIIGSNDINSDVELISLAREVYNRCGISGFKVRINSVGKTGERRNYANKLKEFLQKHSGELSEDSRRRLETNPLRILDSKDKKDIALTDTAPKILESLSAESRNRFERVVHGLTGVGIVCEADFRLVRGIDYYTDTTFEFISEDLGAQDAIGGGGRYDGLTELLGGKPLPGIGFGSGLERVLMAASRRNFSFPEPSGPLVYLIGLNDTARSILMKLAIELRAANISCETDLAGRSLKAQMREANKMKSEYVYIIGEEELKKGKGTLKRMADGVQEEADWNTLQVRLKA